MEGNGTTISDFFSNISEPRESNKRHNLLDIITIALCAVISGCDGWEQMEEFGNAKNEWFGKFLELPHGIPSPDTFDRVFAAIDPSEFQESFIHWIQAIQEDTKGEVVAVDGKTLRRSHNRSADKKPIHMVSAWACQNRMVLGQVKTAEKSNEITAIPQLLQLLDLHGCIVTIDAMGCQRSIAEQIIEKGAEYVLALKGNQGNLHDDIKLFFQDCIQFNFKDVEYTYHETVDGDHGRIETRRYWCTSEIDWLPEKDLWKGLRTVIMVQRERDLNDKVTLETSYYISSMENDPEKLAEAVRSH